MNAMNWSEEQTDIFHFFHNGTGNLVIEAFAGTGKTTTIKAAFEFATEARILYAVFNKRNQKEAEEKISDQRVEVKTLHSLGFAFIKRVWSTAKPDENVEFDRAVAVLAPFPQLAQNREFVAGLVKLVGFLKNCTINPSQKDAYEIAIAQDLLTEEAYLDEKLVCASLQILERSKVRDKESRISFNDMVWLPVAMGIAKPWFDLVCIDEAQDMNLPQLMMARQACKPNGRVVVVGDSRQAIYGFRGAVQNGMNMMKTTLNAHTLMLSTTYRCPKAVVKMAAQIVPDYKAAPEAPEGKVETISSAKLLAEVKIGDAILSRLNAPLMPLALSFLRKNIPARIEGRDIGKQLIGMIRSLKAKSIPDLLEKLRAWEKKQVARLEDSKNAEKRIEQTRDIAETLSAIAEASSSVADCESRLSGLFQDSDEKSRPSVVLSSVHKAKGLEWNRVFLLSETFRASKGGEEANIYYVALTRAKSELYLAGGATGAAEVAEEKAGLAVSTQAPPASVSPRKGISPPPPRKSSTEATNAASEAIKEPARSPKKVTLKLPILEEDNSDIPLGQVRRKVGDVFMFDCAEYIVEKVGSCSAVARCLGRKQITVTNKLTDETKTFEKAPREIRISTCCDKQDVIRRETNFHSQKPSAEGINQKQTGTKENTTMAKAKTEKTGNVMTLIVGLAKAGKSEKDITKAVTSNYGTPSAATAYLIGREWRRVNKVGRHFGTGDAKPAKKAPAKKAAPVKAPKKSAPKTKAPKAGTPPPPRPAAEVENPTEQPAE